MGFEVVAAGGEISGDGQYPYEDTFDSERGGGRERNLLSWAGGGMVQGLKINLTTFRTHFEYPLWW